MSPRGVETMLDFFDATVARSGSADALHYFGATISFAELDARAAGLAAVLQEGGFTVGDRLAIYTQNNPAFVVGLLAAWKAGGVAVLVNPMNKHRELLHILHDSGATALLCLDELYESVARGALAAGDHRVQTVVRCSVSDDQVFAPSSTAFRPARRVRGADVAVLAYTSGTTGAPKGAMITHSNLVFNAKTYRDWIGLTSTDTILGVSPLFHITGLVGHVCVALLVGCALVLAHRFEPDVIMTAIRAHQPTFTIGAITIFLGLTRLPDNDPADWASFRAIYSGGAPIAPSVLSDLAVQTGKQIHNIYGLTETTSPSHAVPLGQQAPVDPVSGALSVGVPVFETNVRIIDEGGTEVATGTLGEIAISGPQVVPGYWNNPEATSTSFVDGELRTGDVGFVDEDGWFYVVDRTKDMINASGYKVWPREVEDVLQSHPGVREVAVVGLADAYRGETVQAFVALEPGARLDEPELIAYAKERMAAYKYPRSVTFVTELPKTASGKILRRELRDGVG